MKKLFTILIASICFNSFAQTTEGLVAYYPLDGNSKDLSVNTNDGTDQNTTYGNGMVGQSVNFNGENSTITIPNTYTSKHDNYTISTWIKINDINAQQTILGIWGHTGTEGQDDFALFWNGNDQKLQFITAPGLGTQLISLEGNNISQSSWFHVTLTKDFVNKKIAIYVNGLKELEGDFSGETVDLITPPLVLGGYLTSSFPSNTFSNLLNGSMDEFRMYNRVLTSIEINELADYAINIPDANFKTALIDLGVDTNNDGQIQKSEADVITSLSINNKNIADLTGLEKFENLVALYCEGNQLTNLDPIAQNTVITALNCSDNQLTSLDVSTKTGLTYLYCYGNNISNLDVTKNPVLDFLNCSGNNLTSLDVTQNPALFYFSCGANGLISLDISNNTSLATLAVSSNNLTSLDVSNNTSLTSLYCDGNELTSLDVTQNTKLTNLYTNINQLTSLDISNNTLLTQLYVYQNNLTSLDVSNNVALEFFGCNENPLTALDITANTALIKLWCYGSGLTNLDISNNINLTLLACNGNNLTSLDVSNNIALTDLNIASNDLISLDITKNTVLTSLNTALNSNLTTICVSDISAANTQANWVKDAITMYSITCNDPIVYIPSGTFRAMIKKLDLNDDGFIQVSEAEALSAPLNLDGDNIFALTGKKITDLTGIQAFVNITQLNISNNEITSLDLSSNTALTEINCDNNSLISLNVTSLTNLKELVCNDNELTTLDVSTTTALTKLICHKNKFTTLDISTNTALKALDCSNNDLVQLNTTNAASLEVLYCSHNQLTTLDVTSNTSLNYLYTNNNSTLTGITFDSADDTNLLRLYLQNNTNLSGTLDISQFKSLQKVKTGNTSLTSLVVSKDAPVTTYLTTYAAYFAPVSPSQLRIDLDPNVNIDFFVIKAYNTQGREVSIDTKGELIFLLYSDGTTEKVFNK